MVMGGLNQTGTINQLMYSDPATGARVNAVMGSLASNRDFAATLFQSGAIMQYVEDLSPLTTKLAMPVLVISGKELDSG
jgi:hypothetical protein